MIIQKPVYITHRKQSERGTSMMDRMEKFNRRNYNDYPQLPYKMKLRAILNNSPQHKFFNSLANLITAKNMLSVRQVNAIDKAFNSLITAKKKAV